jgi:hypothetical protein
MRPPPALDILSPPRSYLNLRRRWEKLLHQPLVVLLQQFDLLSLGADQVVKGREAVGDLYEFSSLKN